MNPCNTLFRNRHRNAASEQAEPTATEKLQRAHREATQLLARVLELPDADDNTPGLTKAERDAFTDMRDKLSKYLTGFTAKQLQWVQSVLRRCDQDDQAVLNLVSSNGVELGQYVAPAEVLMHRPLAPPGRQPSPPNAMERKLNELRKGTR